jgi:hypothetical protein
MTRHKSHKNFFFRFLEKMFKTIILDNVSRMSNLAFLTKMKLDIIVFTKVDKITKVHLSGVIKA